MGIDIYKDRNTSDHLWTIDDASFAELQTSFDIYKLKTGNTIDEYSDIAFPKHTLQPLLDSINDTISSAKQSNSSLKKLRELILDAVNNNHGLYFLGD